MSVKPDSYSQSKKKTKNRSSTLMKNTTIKTENPGNGNPNLRRNDIRN